MHAAHRDLVSWEGRRGLAEPYLELANAYRRAAELVETWYEARRRELAAEAQAAQKERAIADVDFQIRTLRDSLAALDRSLLDRRQRIQQQIAEAGWRTQALEGGALPARHPLLRPAPRPADPRPALRRARAGVTAQFQRFHSALVVLHEDLVVEPVHLHRHAAPCRSGKTNIVGSAASLRNASGTAGRAAPARSKGASRAST